VGSFSFGLGRASRKVNGGTDGSDDVFLLYSYSLMEGQTAVGGEMIDHRSAA